MPIAMTTTLLPGVMDVRNRLEEVKLYHLQLPYSIQFVHLPQSSWTYVWGVVIIIAIISVPQLWNGGRIYNVHPVCVCVCVCVYVIACVHVCVSCQNGV